MSVAPETIAGFAKLGAALFRRTAKLAVATKGLFDSPAASAALAATLAYAEAARNGLAALTTDPDLSLEQRLSLQTAGLAFARALGDAATGFGPVAPRLGLEGLQEGAKKPVALADLFAAGAPIVSVSATATAALEGLRRDPLVLVLDLDAVGQLMAVAVDGVEIVG